MTEPVVERSTKRRTRLPSISPPLPAATASTMSGVGRLAITVSTRSATSRTERRGLRAERGETVDGFASRVEHDDLMPGLDQPAGHVEAHLAEPDEADVHVGFLPRSLLVFVV